MGEIFPREHPAVELPFTGERFTSGTAGQIQIEHLHRYFLAREFSRNKDVLDVACGEGYGSALIAQVADCVIGLEIDMEVVTHASRSYGRDNVHFIQGDARAIPLASASIDVVISFETIEHLYEQEAFIAEVRRVLRPSGIFVVSTPNRDVYSPSESSANPFHVRELTISDFEQMLRARFEWVKCLLQRPLLGSAMLPAESAAGSTPALTFERRGDDYFEGSANLPRAVYAMAVAAAYPVPLPTASLYLEASGIDQRLDQLAQLRAINHRLEAETTRLTSDNERLDILLGQARSENERLELLFGTARAENQRLEALFTTARTENERLEALFITARSENERLEGLLYEARIERERLSVLHEALEGQTRQLSAVVSEKDAVNKELVGASESAKFEIQRLVARLEAITAENERLLSFGVDAKTELTTDRKRFEEQLASSEAARVRAEGERDDTVHRLDELSLRLRQIETSITWRALRLLRRPARRARRSS